MIKALTYDNPDQKIKLKIRQFQVMGRTNVSWFKTHNETGLRDGHPDTSLRNVGIVIGIDRHQH